MPKSTPSTRRTKLCTSDFFNVNFSFTAPSSRTDRSPHISPRSSFSMPCGLPDPDAWMDDIFGPEHGRLDSTSSDIHLDAFTGHLEPSIFYDTSLSTSFLPAKSVSLVQEEFNAALSALRDISRQQVTTVIQDKSSPMQADAQIPDIHPGQLVDFSRLPSCSGPHAVNEPTYSQHKPSLSSDSRKEYPAMAPRRRSLPIKLRSVRRNRQDSTFITRLRALDSHVRDMIMAPASKRSSVSSTPPKATCRPSSAMSSSDASDTSSPALSASSSSASDSTRPSTPVTPLLDPASEMLAKHIHQGPALLRRTVSDSSAEAFLKHIRASLEARKNSVSIKWTDYLVFTDEDERGFLDDAPL